MSLLFVLYPLIFIGEETFEVPGIPSDYWFDYHGRLHPELWTTAIIVE